MATNKKRQGKKHRPREARRDIVALLFDGDQPLPDHQRASLLLAVHASAASLVKGDAPRIAWHDITNALNIAQILCEKAGNSDVGLEVIFAAQNAMIAVGERCHAVGRLGVSGDEMRAINDGLPCTSNCSRWRPSASTPMPSLRESAGLRLATW